MEVPREDGWGFAFLVGGGPILAFLLARWSTPMEMGMTSRVVLFVYLMVSALLIGGMHTPLVQRTVFRDLPASEASLQGFPAFAMSLMGLLAVEIAFLTLVNGAREARVELDTFGWHPIVANLKWDWVALQLTHNVVLSIFLGVLWRLSRDLGAAKARFTIVWSVGYLILFLGLLTEFKDWFVMMAP